MIISAASSKRSRASFMSMPKIVVLAPREPAADAEHRATLAQVVEQDHLLDDAQRVVPQGRITAPVSRLMRSCRAPCSSGTAMLSGAIA